MGRWHRGGYAWHDGAESYAYGRCAAHLGTLVAPTLALTPNPNPNPDPNPDPNPSPTPSPNPNPTPNPNPNPNPSPNPSTTPNPTPNPNQVAALGGDAHALAARGLALDGVSHWAMLSQAACRARGARGLGLGLGGQGGRARGLGG